MQSVLVYTWGELLGDGVWKLPLLPALREAFPGARVAWYAGAQGTVYAGPLAFAAKPFIDEIIIDARSGPHALSALNMRPFGGRRFDVVIDTQTKLAGALAARRAASTLYVSARDIKASATRDDSEGARLHALVERAAGRKLARRLPPLTDERSEAAALALLPEDATYIGFAPGAGGADRRWPIERFCALARAQSERGRIPVVFLGPAEAPLAQQIRMAVPRAVAPEQDRGDAFEDVQGPRLLFALAKRLKAALANDSGGGHVLGAGGAPLVSLFRTARLRRKFRPLAESFIGLAGDEFGGEPDVAAIPAEAADSALEQLIRASDG